MKKTRFYVYLAYISKFIFSFLNILSSINLRSGSIFGKNSICSKMSLLISIPGATSMRVIPFSSILNTARSVTYKISCLLIRACLAENVICSTFFTNFFFQSFGSKCTNKYYLLSTLSNIDKSSWSSNTRTKF